MKFNCPKCDKTLEVDDASAGLHTECPLCTEPLVIPTAHPIRLANPSIKTPSIPDSGILGFVSNISGAMKISAVLHFTPGNLKITYVATGFLGLGKEKVEILDPTPYVLTVDILDIGTGEMRSLDAAKGTLEGTTYGAYSLTYPSELKKNICLGIVQCLSNA